ncbi:WH2 domain-containing protein [Caenorhabditis elegans]|nr:WH2 domain-containing protein [Caenorhabditis elegans]CAH2659122.1 WH2 domain-containing protein [Caenorhabditis elegans]
MSPISSSVSSASAPSPSSLSAGSVSPDSTPKKRIVGSNANFEKAKEKWGAAPKADDSPPTTRGYLMRESKTPTREETTPVREKTPVKTIEEPKSKKHPFMSSNVPPSSLSAREQLFSSSSLPRHHRNSSNQNVINVPISAPWYSRDPIVNPEPPSVGSRRPSKQSTNPYRISFDEFTVPHPSQMRDNIRFNIDLSHDLPLSISRR